MQMFKYFYSNFSESNFMVYSMSDYLVYNEDFNFFCANNIYLRLFS